MSILRRVVAAVVFVGLSLLALSRLRPRGYNRLFFYGRTKDFPLGRAAVATIGPDHFAFEREFTYSDWSLVTSAANGENMWLLFHSSEIGTAIGLIDDNFIFRIKKFYAPHALSFSWSYAIVDGRGYLMLVGTFIGSTGLTLGFAQVLDDGTYVEWWRTVWPDFPFEWGSTLLGLKNAHAWFTNESSTGPSTVTIFDVKDARILSSRQWSAPLRNMVVDGDVVFLYFGDPLRTTELCLIDQNWQIVTIKRMEFDFEAYTVQFNDIASTPGAHLLYSKGTFDEDGAIRVLSRYGFKLTKRWSKMDFSYDFVAQC